MKSAQQMADNWKSAMASPQTAAKYKQGIANCNVNPMALAATPQAQQLYAQNTALAVSSGRMAAKLNAVPVDRWKTNAQTHGAAALSAGASKASPKVQAHFQQWAGTYQQMSDAANAIPKDGSTASALARVQAAITIAKQAAGKPA